MMLFGILWLFIMCMALLIMNIYMQRFLERSIKQDKAREPYIDALRLTARAASGMRVGACGLCPEGACIACDNLRDALLFLKEENEIYLKKLKAFI